MRCVMLESIRAEALSYRVRSLMNVIVFQNLCNLWFQMFFIDKRLCLIT